MARQIPDGMKHEGNDFVILYGPAQFGFDVHDHALFPIGHHTANHRGYWCEYSVIDNRLMLDELHVNTAADFYIDVLPSDEAPGLVARISTGNWALTRDALSDGAGYYETVRCDTVDGVYSLYATVRICDGGIGGLVADIINACLILDGAIAAAMAHDAGDNSDFREAEFDSVRLFEAFGFGADAPAIARGFDEECGHPYDRALAAFALPYNLQKAADSGVLDAVIAECDGAFGLYRMAWRRWLFCEEIVAALQARGFFEALGSGVVISLSPVHEECFYVCSSLRWDEFIGAVNADLCGESDEGAECPDQSVRERAQRLLDGPPCRASADGGSIPVSEAISKACGIEANERLHVIGNSGYFEVWRKPAYDEALSSFDILDVLLGGEGEQRHDEQGGRVRQRGGNPHGRKRESLWLMTPISKKSLIT